MPLLTVAPTRYVLLVLGDPTARLTQLLRRAPAGRHPAPEIVTCATAQEVEVRLLSGRRYSAVVAGPDHLNLDGGIVLAARRTRTPLLALSEGLSSTPDRLRSAIAATAAPVPWVERPWDGTPSSGDQRGRIVAVCGPGGTGTSTVAAGLAAGLGPGLGADRTGATAWHPELLLADFALHADQAALHDRPEPPPEVTSDLLGLVDACRRRGLEPGQLRDRTQALGAYRLLTGLRRPRHWTAVSPGAFGTLLEQCAHDFALVVADVTSDLEGEEDVGSIDVEERNHMARRVTAWADLVVVVGTGGTLGRRRLTLTLDELLDHGVDAARLQPVVNRSHRGAEPVQLCGLPELAVPLPDLGPESSARPGPPAGLVAPLLAVVLGSLNRLPPAPMSAEPVPLAPGSLGCARIGRE